MRPPNHQKLAQLVISAVAVNCAYGDHPAALFGGISTRLSCRTKAEVQVNGPDQGVETPYWAACEELPIDIPAELRLQLLCQGALEQLPLLTGALTTTLIINLLPTPSHLQDEQLFKDNLTALYPEAETATVLQYVVTTSATSLLEKILSDFHQGSWQRLIFGATDCLVDSSTLADAMQQHNCCSDLNPDRRLLGEGAAYLIIDKVDHAVAGQILLAGLAHKDEPNSGNAADKATMALAECISTAMTHSGLDCDRLDGVISGYVPDIPGTLEWHQTERKLWPAKGHRPQAVEELNPHLGCGDCGSAALPLALVLAHARFEFAFAPVTTLAVCDISSQPYRGAICLQRTCR